MCVCVQGKKKKRFKGYKACDFSYINEKSKKKTKFMLTFYLSSLAVAKFTHIHATTFLYPWCLQIKWTYMKKEHLGLHSLHNFRNKIHDTVHTTRFRAVWDFILYKNKMKKWLIIIINKAQKTNELTHWRVKSNMFLVRVEILVLLPTEFTNIAPSFWKQENT